MTSNKNLLPDTLYITMKVIDRARIDEPELYSRFEKELIELNANIRDVLDKLDSMPARKP